MLILESGKIISSDFTKVLLLYNESTYETADIIGTYVYREGILGGKFEYTTAIGLLTSLFSLHPSDNCKLPEQKDQREQSVVRRKSDE